jgi:uncharacterized membrane protein
MTPRGGPISGRVRLRLLALGPILVLLLLLVFLPPDGTERAEWAQFIGRFHPLAVHLPIALVLLVPVLKLAGLDQRFLHLPPAANFLMGLAVFSAIVASILGWCLARSGGYSGPLVTQHMWGGLSVTALCWLCWTLPGRLSVEGSDLVYSIALVASVGLVAWTGYRGGQLSQGANHLTEYMPATLRRILRLSDHLPTNPGDGGPTTFYGARVQPVFAAHCFTCHGTDKQKANLRLDSYGFLLRGGKHGPVVKPGNPQGSDLFRRITLPPSDDDFMPKEGKPPLPANEVKVIELWIAAGASGTEPVEAIKDAPTTSPSMVVATEVRFEEISPDIVAKIRAGLAPAVSQLQERYPSVLDYESRSSADLMLNASHLGAGFGDDDVAALTALSEHIVLADFSRTAITDRSARPIAAMKRLRVLRLAQTKISDATVQALGALDQLESLSVFGTAVTPAILPVVARLPKLKHFYAGETAIRADASIPETLKDKAMF